MLFITKVIPQHQRGFFWLVSGRLASIDYVRLINEVCTRYLLYITNLDNIRNAACANSGARRKSKVYALGLRSTTVYSQHSWTKIDVRVLKMNTLSHQRMMHVLILLRTSENNRTRIVWIQVLDSRTRRCNNMDFYLPDHCSG